MSGKGDAYRPVDLAKYASNWDRIFAIKKDRASASVSSAEGLRETSSDGVAEVVGRCPNTIDIEEEIERQDSVKAEVGGSRRK